MMKIGVNEDDSLKIQDLASQFQVAALLRYENQSSGRT